MSYTLFDDSELPPVAAPSPSKRERDRVWEALSEWFGEPATHTEIRLRGRMVQSLIGAGATPELIHERANAWINHFPGATLTVTALEKHWTQLGLPPLRADADFARRGHETCLNCDGSGYMRSYSPGAGMVATPCRVR